MLKLSQNEPIGWHKAVSEPRQTQEKPKKISVRGPAKPDGHHVLLANDY
jgi:hypothetical protein